VSTQDTSAEGYAARLARIEAALALTPRSRCDDWDSDTVEWLLAQLRERDRQLAEAREVLAPLLDEPDAPRSGDGEYDFGCCVFCTGEVPGMIPGYHESTCPVLRKDVILGRQASDEARA
jgi:hypothetical protein